MGRERASRARGPIRRQPPPVPAIAIDVGDQDGLRADATRLHEALDKYQIGNLFEVYAGTHTSRVADRFQNHVMRFFSQNLCVKTHCP